MQGGPEKVTFNSTTGIGVTTNNRTISLSLFAPYKQQALDFKNLMSEELHNKFSSLEERVVFCMRAKNKAIEEMARRSAEMEVHLRKALAEAEFWRKSSDQKTALSQDLAGRLLKLKRKEKPVKMIAETYLADDAESYAGENGYNVLGTARTRKCRRRRL